MFYKNVEGSLVTIVSEEIVPSSSLFAWPIQSILQAHLNQSVSSSTPMLSGLDLRNSSPLTLCWQVYTRRPQRSNNIHKRQYNILTIFIRPETFWLIGAFNFKGLYFIIAMAQISRNAHEKNVCIERYIRYGFSLPSMSSLPPPGDVKSAKQRHTASFHAWNLKVLSIAATTTVQLGFLLAGDQQGLTN